MGYKAPKIELLNCDCMEYMRGLESDSFDIMITSPPYNMNLRVNSKGNGYCSRQIVKEVSTKYKNFSDNLPMAEYEKFLFEFLSQAIRISKTVFFNIQQITGNKPAIAKALGYHSNSLKETIIWDKGRCQPSIAKGVLNSQFEFIHVFGGNPIARQFKDCNFQRGTESNLWHISPESSKDREHRAGFPLALPEKILDLFAGDHSRVIDPFLGTGTTAIAAHSKGHDFVGCELDKDYYAAACKRFDNETSQIDMF